MKYAVRFDVGMRINRAQTSHGHHREGAASDIGKLSDDVPNKGAGDQTPVPIP